MSDTPALYDAFISYSHAKDKPVAAALQTIMQKLGKPWYQRRSLRIFRDDTSLSATPELWPALEKTIDQTRYIILLASPEFARSKWCAMEVAHWLMHKELHTLLIAVTDGEPRWDSAANDFAWDDATPLPAVMRGNYRNEPKWIDLRAFRDDPDVRNPRFVDAAADLAAAVHGIPKEDLLSQEVRQQKRALRLAWGAAASLTLLAGGASWQWWEAESARASAVVSERQALVDRDRAEQSLALSRRAANELVEKVTGGLKDARGLRAESVRQILGTSMEVIETLQKNVPQSAELKRNRADLLQSIAATYSHAGDTEGALKASEEAIAINRKFLEADPNDETAEYALLVNYDRLGTIYLQNHKYEHTQAAYEEAVKIARKRAAARPADTMRQRELARALQGVGLIQLTRQDKVAGNATCAEVVALLERLFTIETSKDLRHDFSSIISHIADVKVAALDYEGALRDFAVALSMRERLAREFPGALNLRLSQTNERIADTYVKMRNRADAASHYERSLALLRSYGNGPEWLDAWLLLTETATKYADMQAAAGERAKAVTLYEEVLELWRRLSGRDPTRADWQNKLTIAFDRVGDAKIALEDYAGALKIAEEGVLFQRQAVATNGGDVEVHRNLARILARVGDVKVRTRDPKGALASYEEAVKVTRALLVRDPANRQWRGDIAAYQGGVGRAAQDLGDRAAARGAFGEALTIWQDYLRAEPNNTDLQYGVAVRSVVYASVAEPAQARQAYNAALSLLLSLEQAGKLDAQSRGWIQMVRGELTRLANTPATTQ